MGAAILAADRRLAGSLRAVVVSDGNGDAFGRRGARERALSLLYEAEAKDLTPEEVLAQLPVAPDRYAIEVTQGVGQRAEEIDELIRRYSKDWKLERMPAVDRALLRIAIFELMARPDVPKAVVINEAVELAKRFSTEESGRFVNGMLSRISEEVRNGPGGGPTTAPTP